MVPVEIYINSKSKQHVLEAVGNAWSGGAGRIELCASMEHDGLTPPVGHTEIARKAFRKCSGLMVMIRPKPGDFFISPMISPQWKLRLPMRQKLEPMVLLLVCWIRELVISTGHIVNE